MARLCDYDATHEVIRDEKGEIIELRCTYDEDTLGKNPANRKVKGVIHWVSCSRKLMLCGYLSRCWSTIALFNDANPAREDDFMQFLNHDSLESAARLTVVNLHWQIKP